MRWGWSFSWDRYEIRDASLARAAGGGLLVVAIAAYRSGWRDVARLVGLTWVARGVAAGATLLVHIAVVSAFTDTQADITALSARTMHVLVGSQGWLEILTVGPDAIVERFSPAVSWWVSVLLSLPFLAVLSRILRKTSLHWRRISLVVFAFVVALCIATDTVNFTLDNAQAKTLIRVGSMVFALAVDLLVVGLATRSVVECDVPGSPGATS
jgi:hypothetical protein